MAFAHVCSNLYNELTFSHSRIACSSFFLLWAPDRLENYVLDREAATEELMQIFRERSIWKKLFKLICSLFFEDEKWREREWKGFDFFCCNSELLDDENLSSHEYFPLSVINIKQRLRVLKGITLDTMENQKWIGRCSRAVET